MEKVSRIHKSGLTFAPEAGNQRMRDVINKNVDEEEIMRTCRIAFEGGYTNVKLYFMSSLPTETDEDVKDIGRLAQRIVDLFFSLEKRPRKMVNVSISVAVFVPKCDTPFQWVGQDTFEVIERKQKALVGLHPLPQDLGLLARRPHLGPRGGHREGRPQARGRHLPRLEKRLRLRQLERVFPLRPLDGGNQRGRPDAGILRQPYPGPG